MLDLRYRIHRRTEKFLLWFVWKLPRTLVMWCAIRVGAHATTGIYGDTIVPQLTFMDALERWNPRHAIVLEAKLDTLGLRLTP